MEVSRQAEGRLDAFSLDEAILKAAELSEGDGIRISDQLASAGQPYQAARCLEVVIQRRLGLELTGRELTGFEEADFGAFHARILALLHAGSLFLEAGRPRTARSVIMRSLLFVEEALRRVEPPSDEWAALGCLGLGFELAGHCCAASEEADGLEYYQAAHEYWDRAVRSRPEAFPQWTMHPVTDTVIRCLVEAGRIRRVEEERLEARDFPTRLEAARALLGQAS